jgi:hypothetical protein
MRTAFALFIFRRNEWVVLNTERRAVEDPIRATFAPSVWGIYERVDL